MLPPAPAAPRHVLLFSGHMVDAPGRPVPRFPPSLVPAVAEAIGAALQSLQAGPADLAIAQAASGGDLLFLEACEARGVPLQVMLPMPLPAYVDSSVRPAIDGPQWLARLEALQRRGLPAPMVLPADAGDPHDDLYERVNHWMLEAAMCHGPERVRFICLWDGGGGDGPGGTRHMMDVVRARQGAVHWIDLRALSAPR